MTLALDELAWIEAAMREGRCPPEVPALPGLDQAMTSSETLMRYRRLRLERSSSR